MSQPTAKQISDQQRTTLKIMRYNRFLIVRYVCACLFFINLYMSLLYFFSHSYLLLFPLLLIIVQLPAIWEQIKLYSTPMNDINFTKGFFILQTVISVGVCLTTMTSFFNFAFPFLTVTFTSRFIIAIIALCLIGICLAMLIRLKKISLGTDRQYKRMQQYQQSL